MISKPCYFPNTHSKLLSLGSLTATQKRVLARFAPVGMYMYTHMYMHMHMCGSVHMHMFVCAYTYVHTDTRAGRLPGRL